MNSFLDKAGLQRLWGKIKALIPTKVSELENDSRYITDKEKDYLTFEALEAGAFGFVPAKEGQYPLYSKNEGEWTSLNESVSVVKGDLVRMKGTLKSSLGNNGIGTFTSEGTFNVFGNIMSLCYGDSFLNKYTIEETYIFSRLFNGTKIVDARHLTLPAKKLLSNSYIRMFQDCVELLHSPEVLPATELAAGCYIGMFQGCTKLEEAPVIAPATYGQNPFNTMFKDCTSLRYIKTFTPPYKVVNGKIYFYSTNWVNNVAAEGVIVLAYDDNLVKYNESSFINVHCYPPGWDIRFDDVSLATLKSFAKYEEVPTKTSDLTNDSGFLTDNIETTYADLVTLRDNSELIPGQRYRITDYVTTVNETELLDARSAGHAFDIIVTATDVNMLSEDAKAVQHEGDTYFSNSRLEAWELKYQLDNVEWSQIGGTIANVEQAEPLDVSNTTAVTLGGHTYQRVILEYMPSTVYILADAIEVGQTIYIYDGEPEDFTPSALQAVGQVISIDVVEAGKGTITWMKDEHGNECPYDFKNIQFKRWKVTDNVNGREGLDGLYMMVRPNEYVPVPGLSVEDMEDFIWAFTFSSDSAGGEQADYSLTDEYDVGSNVFLSGGSGLLDNVMFGGGNRNNSFGPNCRNNTIDSEFSKNSVGVNSSYNSIAKYAEYNSIGGNFYLNSIGNSFRFNSVENGFYGNTIDVFFSNNTIGCSFSGNSLGKNFEDNSIQNSFMGSVIASDFSKNTIASGVSYINVPTSYVRNINVLSGVAGNEINKLTLSFAANKLYSQIASKNSSGALKIWVPDDASSGTQIPTIAFGTSTTAAATAQKDVSIPAITELNSGQIIIIKPTVTSTVKNSTIKLNSFAAYPMRYKNAAITVTTAKTVWEANVPSTWVFDGTYWIFAGHGFDNDTTYTTMDGSESESSTTGRLVTGSSLSSFIETYLENHTLVTMTIDSDIDSFVLGTTSYSFDSNAEQNLIRGVGNCILRIKIDGHSSDYYLFPSYASDGYWPEEVKFKGVINNKEVVIGLEYGEGLSIYKYDVVNLFSGSYNDLSDKPTIPAAVTESTVSGWGFTKNTGTYSKPSGGIPSSDLATAVQNALTAAGTALQPADLNTLNGKVAALESLVSEGDNPTAAIDKFNEIVAFLANITNTDTLNGILGGINEAIAAKYTKPSGGIPKTDLATAVQTSLGKADTALQSFTETDPTVPSHVKSITTTDISNWNGKTSNVGTITGITMNGASKGTSGVVNLGTVLTEHQSIKTINNQALTGTGNVTINEVPSYSASDNGKILSVVNGALAWVTPTAIYSGTAAPNNASGNNGDLYLQTS